MSSLSEWFGWTTPAADDEFPSIYTVPISEGDFVSIDITAIYSKILIDVLERTEGLSDDQVALMWDNCLKSEKADGLVTMVSKAMADKKELFLVYEKALNVIREANSDEQVQIKADFKANGKSSKGIYVTFQNFRRSDMVKFYLALSYCTVGSLWKSMNLSKAVQIKISDLRKSVSLTDAASAKTQAKQIATALGAGRDVYMDEKDEIATAVPDLSATKEAVLFVGEKLAFYLSMPDSYLTGAQTEGIGSTGENDMRAVERGLKGYYFSIMKPLLEALLEVKTTYKTQDFSLIESSSDILKTFALVDDTLVSAENKRKIINSLLGLPEDAQGDPPPKVQPVVVEPPAKPGQKPPPEATA